MNDKLKDINKFFEILHSVKNILYNTDYNLFISQFLKSLVNIYNLVDIWKFINNINMMVIYNNLINNIKSENYSILDENNILSKTMLFNIINSEYFKGEYFFGLFDYIYFEDRFIFEEEGIMAEKEENKKLGIYGKFERFHDKLYFFSNDNYSYLYESIKAKNLEKKENVTKWNQYIIEEYNKLKLNIIYHIFDYLDLNIYKCRKFFYITIINTIIDNEKYLENVTFINALISLIIQDKYHIFEIFAIDKENDGEMFYQNNFEIFIKMISKRIFNKMGNKNEKNTIDIITNNNEELEIINSLLLLLKLLGEYNNINFHDIICKNFNEDSEDKTADKDNKKQDEVKKEGDIINIDNDKNIIIDQEKDNINDKEGNNIGNNFIIKNEININVINNNEKNKDNHKNDGYIIIEKLFDFFFQYTEFIKKLYDADFSIINNNINNWNNILIVFHSLIQCIIEFTNIREDLKNKIINLLENNSENEDNAQDVFLGKLIEDYKISESNKNKQFEEINESTYKSIFILLNYTYLDIFCAKFLNKRLNNKFSLILKSYIEMKICFDVILYFHQDKFKLQIDEINNDKETLFELYVDNKIGNRLIFNAILLNYQLAFIVSNIPDFEEFKYLFHINNERNNQETIVKIIEKYLKEDYNELLLLFSFLQDIHDQIEIRQTKESNVYILNTLNPENFRLNRYSLMFFDEHINYNDRETKLLSIYNYIDCFIYDMKHKYKIENMFNYRFWEIVNYIGIVIENIFLIVLYTKSTDDSINNYNKIENRQKFPKFSIFGTIHIILLSLIIIFWSITRAYVDFLYAKTKYEQKNLTRNSTVFNKEVGALEKSNTEKYILNNEINRYTQHDYLNLFLNWVKKETIVKNIYKFFIILFYSLRTIYPFIVSLICLFLFLCSWQLSLIIPLFLIFNLNETLLAIIKVLFKEAITLSLLFFFMMIIIYFFSWIGFF